MTDTPLVGVHLGTSSVSIDIYDLEGSLIAEGEAPIEEQTTIGWERALRAAAPNLPSTGICSVTSTSGTILLVDKYGEPVFPPEMYYNSAPEEVERVRQSTTGSELANWEVISSSTAPLPKILRLRQEYPKRFEKVEWIMSPTTWVLYRLQFGSSSVWRHVETDWTNAMKFGANIERSLPRWHLPLFHEFDLSPSLFPDIRPPGSFIGVARSEVANRIGFDGLRLYQGMTDGSASALANGCLEPDDFSVTYGATSRIKYVQESITPNDITYYHRHPLDGYLLSASFDSGSVLRWYFDRVLNIPHKYAFELAESVPHGEEYDVFLQSHRSPLYDPAVGTSILGINCDLSLSTEAVRGRIARGLVSGIILAEWTYIERIQNQFDTTIETISLMNDGAPNLKEDYSWLNTLRAQIWNRPVREMEPRMTAGLLIPPTLIASEYSDRNEAVEHLLRERTTIEPDDDQPDQYEDRRNKYLDRWQTVGDLQR